MTKNTNELSEKWQTDPFFKHLNKKRLGKTLLNVIQTKLT